MDDYEGERASSHTSTRMTTRVEIVGRVSGRRRWTVEQKLGICVMLLGLAAQFWLRWNVTILAAARFMSGGGRRCGELTGMRPAALSVAGPAFAEVEISEPVIAAAPAPSLAQHDGQIGIELPSGVRLTVDAAVDADALARVIAVLVR